MPVLEPGSRSPWMMNKALAASLLIVLAAGGIAYSAFADLQMMARQSFLLVIVDDAKANEVELGFGLVSRGDALGPFVLDVRGSTGGVLVRDAFSRGLNVGASMLIGRALPGVYIEKGTRGSASFERIIIVPVGVLARVVDAIGGVDFTSPEPSEVKVTRQLSGYDFATLLRSDGFSGTGRWRVSYVDAQTQERVTKDLEGDEFGDLASRSPGIDRESAWAGVKFLVFNSAVQELAERGSEDKALLRGVIEILAREYSRGGIRTYPENTATRLPRIIPAGFIAEKVTSMLTRG